MTDPRLSPPRSMPTYAVRAPLARWLGEEARRAHSELGRFRVLDVGCGDKPYEPLFAPFASAYVGVDAVDNPHAEIRGFAEDLPVDDGVAELVLCIQVLEHVNDPAAVVRELARVTAPGGRVLLSTHGVMAYHPSPADHWRWTQSGLERIFRENADWSSVRVTPASGTTACIAMLTSLYLDLVARKAHAGALAKPLIAAANVVAAAIDRRIPSLADPAQPGTLFANYHVVAERGGTHGSPASPSSRRGGTHGSSTGPLLQRPAQNPPQPGLPAGEAGLRPPRPAHRTRVTQAATAPSLASDR